MTKARPWGLLLVGLVGFLVWVTMSPLVTNYDSEIRSVDRSNTLNAAATESAPQQEVVNGWTTIGYLEVIAEQNNAALEQGERDGVLIGLAVLALCWIGLTSRPENPPSVFAQSAGGPGPEELRETTSEDRYATQHSDV